MALCLTVDDNEVNRYAASEMVKICGFESAEAENAIKGLDFCENSMPNYIILDIMMPDMDGYEFMTKLKVIEKKIIPNIIISSAKNREEDKKRAFDIGASDYIIKPLRLNDLKNTLLNLEKKSN